MNFSKKGKFALEGTAMTVVYGFIALILVFALAAAFLPTVLENIATIGNITDLPLASLWTGGVIGMIVVIGVVILVIKQATNISK